MNTAKRKVCSTGSILVYEKNLRWLLESNSHRMIAFAIVGVLLFGAVLLLPLKQVVVKMLPFDNKSEMQVIIDTPEGTTLEQTAALTKEIGQYLADNAGSCKLSVIYRDIRPV